MLVIVILICVTLILLGVAVGKPLGWISAGFTVLAFILALVPHGALLR